MLGDPPQPLQRPDSYSVNQLSGAEQLHGRRGVQPRRPRGRPVASTVRPAPLRRSRRPGRARPAAAGSPGPRRTWPVTAVPGRRPTGPPAPARRCRAPSRRPVPPRIPPRRRRSRRRRGAPSPRCCAASPPSVGYAGPGTPRRSAAPVRSSRRPWSRSAIASMCAASTSRKSSPAARAALESLDELFRRRRRASRRVEQSAALQGQPDSDDRIRVSAQRDDVQQGTARRRTGPAGQRPRQLGGQLSMFGAVGRRSVDRLARAAAPIRPDRESPRACRATGDPPAENLGHRTTRSTGRWCRSSTNSGRRGDHDITSTASQREPLTASGR